MEACRIRLFAFLITCPKSDMRCVCSVRAMQQLSDKVTWSEIELSSGPYCCATAIISQSLTVVHLDSCRAEIVRRVFLTGTWQPMQRSVLFHGLLGWKSLEQIDAVIVFGYSSECLRLQRGKEWDFCRRCIWESGNPTDPTAVMLYTTVVYNGSGQWQLAASGAIRTGSNTRLHEASKVIQNSLLAFPPHDTVRRAPSNPYLTGHVFPHYSRAQARAGPLHGCSEELRPGRPCECTTPLTVIAWVP